MIIAAVADLAGRSALLGRVGFLLHSLAHLPFADSFGRRLVLLAEFVGTRARGRARRGC